MASPISIATPQNFTRRAGSGFTIFTFAGQPIAFCQQVQHTSPRPVGQGASAIQPMDEPYPVEIITPAAAGMGQIVLNLFELFGTNGKASKVWDRLGATLGGSSSSTNPFGSPNTSGLGNTSNINAIGANGPFQGLVDIVDIFIQQAQLTPQQMQIVQFIRPPALVGASTATPYFLQYVGCVITDVQDGEQIDVGTLEVVKQITVAYRYVLRDGQPSAAFTFRDSAL